LGSKIANEPGGRAPRAASVPGAGSARLPRMTKLPTIAALALVAALATACSGSAATQAPTPAPATATPAAAATGSTAVATAAASPSPNTSGVPAFDHVYVLVMENKEFGEIVGSTDAPYINSLVSRYGLATNYFAARHPSQPNYIALTSGGLQGTDSNNNYDLDVPTVFDQVEAAGRTWHMYAQSYPGDCFTGASAAPVADGPGAAGDYARKHNPAISYVSISGDPARCAGITGLAGFDPAAFDFEMIIPNQINDMHSSSVKAGDDFLAAFLPSILESSAFANSVLFLTWEEGTTNVEVGGRVATIVMTPGMSPGWRDEGHRTHYSMVRTIELAWGMPLLGEASTATTLDFPW
jgi:phosphatidylinositol-3-phosphatase